jgi:predicted amidophosphoribosyltransferase
MLRSLLAPPLCWSCHAPALRREPLCRACRRALRFLPRAPVNLGGLPVWAPVAYEGPARELVKGLKFHGATAIVDAMAALIVAGAPEGMLGEAPSPAGPPPSPPPPPRAALIPGPPPSPPPPPRAALIPVPLHRRRRRARGFNQAEALAAAVAGRTGLPLADCLARAGPDRRQVGRGRAARLAGPAGAIAVAPGGLPREALLVDDVVTTGGTLAACAAALRQAGVQSVEAIAFARTAGR